jgi:hypothetical protein
MVSGTDMYSSPQKLSDEQVGVLRRDAGQWLKRLRRKPRPFATRSRRKGRRFQFNKIITCGEGRPQRPLRRQLVRAAGQRAKILL